MGEDMAQSDNLFKEYQDGTHAAAKERREMAPFLAEQERARAVVLEAEAELRMAEAATAYELARKWNKVAAEEPESGD